MELVQLLHMLVTINNFFFLGLPVILELFSCHLCPSKLKYYRSYLDHIRVAHGAKLLPWTCGICYKYDFNESPCFPTANEMLYHWKTKHPDIKEAKDVIHTEYGSHYTFFPFQSLEQSVEKRKGANKSILQEQGSNNS